MMNVTTAHRNNLTLVEKVIRDAFIPLQSGISIVRGNLNEVVTAFSNKSALQQQIKKLEEENSKLTLENQQLREYKHEVIQLRLMLDFQDSRENYSLLPAHIIARNPNNWYRCVTLDRGLKHGIKNGMPVISTAGLVGRVASVSENSAQVSLITDRETAVGAIIQETRETNGIVEGLGNSNQLRMINIPYYSKIKKGDIIITSGLSAVYPPGIRIGRVTEVSREPNGLLLVAMVKPAVNLDKLEAVFVVTDYQPVTNSEVEEE